MSRHGDTMTATASKYWQEATDVINRIDEIPRDEKAEATRQRFKDYIKRDIGEMVKALSVVGRDLDLEEAILDVINSCPKNIRDNFLATIIHIMGKIQRQRKNLKLENK